MSKLLHVAADVCLSGFSVVVAVGEADGDVVSVDGLLVSAIHTLVGSPHPMTREL